jgi:hypothetical protein
VIIDTNTTFKIFSSTLTSYQYGGGQMKDSEMGRECGMHGTEEKCIQTILRKFRRNGDTWKILENGNKRYDSP